MSSSDPGLIANRFRSLFVIGRGGMGSVDAALEVGNAGVRRIVALKRMLPESSVDRHHIDMFMREARVAEMLSHPNVVHAFAWGEDERELFLAMEYVEGEPLSRVLTAVHAKEGRVAAPLVAHILADICEGLHAAHELADASGKPLNLIHRDVSPHNVMVAYTGPVKLLDFGVVKIDQLDAKGRTRTGEIKGKTAYMSPEQAMGEPLDRRSDLYSLGAVLFESIAGQRMWGTGTDFDVLRRLALEEPPRLSDVCREAPRALCDLHQRLVARDRSARPPTARAVGQELRAFIRSTGTHPDERVVRAVMQRVFHLEIERRHQALAHALDDAVPGEASEVMRRSLVSGLSETMLDVASPVDAQPPVVVRAQGMISIPVPAGPVPGPAPEGTAPYTDADTEVDAGAALSHGDGDGEIDRPVLPLARLRVLPWAIGAAALLVVGSVAFLKWSSPSVGPGAHAEADPPPTHGSAPTSTPRLDASGTNPPPTLDPKPPHVGLSLAPEPQPPTTASPPSVAPVSVPAAAGGAAGARPPKGPHSPPSSASSGPSTPAPLPLDEHPI